MSDFTDDQISEYENKIREENWKKEPLVSPRLPISVLLEEFKNSQFECADVQVTNIRHWKNNIKNTELVVVTEIASLGHT